jgi:hypothetical protein
MTADELRQALEAAGVDIPVDARKADLQALYAEHAPSPVVEAPAGRPTHMTRLEARAWSER